MVSVLGITLARGGSKRLPRKNIKKLQGLPLIEYTINAARKSRHIDRYIVSTDDQQIADVAANAGAQVPFLRPASLANDTASAMDACLHVLDYCKSSEGFEPEILVLLQATSPLRTEHHIDEALALMEQQDAQSIVSMSTLEYHPNTLLEKTTEGMISPFCSDSDLLKNGTNQELYRINGAIYAIKTASLYKNKSFFGPSTLPYIMSREHSIDIDTALDFQIASLLMQDRSD
ncbi:cytidylyltransferase domain-containing protein [Thalassobacillus sp. CUG 92003]|uniref:acylneuraminate cytidylyltransferase family protein n=1 Tax=Thalassobacillus sp. CUG 92003 TaxID=2736641 RepID=UPI0015E7B902|nr:acylneuraminate cytidylyltransferase family protein [Thalassobacillus sp. CUG 92003]